MGQKIITNHKDSFKLFSTISDSIIAEFKTEKELVNYIALTHFHQFFVGV